MAKIHKEQIGNATLFLGDCFSILDGLIDYDCVVTDPPYGLGKSAFTGAGKARKRAARNNFKKVIEWDKAPDMQPIVDLKVPTIIWGGNYFTLPPSRNWLAWTKGNSMKNRTFAEMELAWCSWDGNARYFEYNPLLQGEKLHPTQKPVELMSFCIDHLPKKCNALLDPFMGGAVPEYQLLKEENLLLE